MENQTTKIPSGEQIGAAMETIDRLATWLTDAKLSEAQVAQFKFNSLAAMYPELRGVVEMAKQSLGTACLLTEVGMTVTEVAARLTEKLSVKVKPDTVNKALMTLGYQERNETKRIWTLTEAGSAHGISMLATSTTNKWSGPQLKWYTSVVPILEDYLREAGILDGDSSSQGAATLVDIKSFVSSEDNQLITDTNDNSANTEDKASWTIPERIKTLGITVSANQVQLIQTFADESYTEQYNSHPPKLKVRKSHYSTYPGELVEVLDKAIHTVLSPKKTI